MPAKTSTTTRPRTKTPRKRTASSASLTYIPLSEYAKRRQATLKALRGAAALIYAGSAGNELDGPFQPNPHFVYLTGITDEPNAVLLLDPKASDPRRKVTLFLTHHDPEVELWHGYRDRISTSLKARYGIDSVMRLGAMPRVLTQVARITKRFAMLHNPSMPGSPVSPDLEMYRKLAHQVVGVSIEDKTGLLPGMRAVKSSNELALMQRAIDITASGFEAAIAAITPGSDEADIARTLVRAFEDAGAQGLAYAPIVGAGLHTTILHYTNNRGPVGANDLLLIDAGARYAGYNADVTRTYPVSGRFGKRQRHIYDIVLKAQLAAIAAAKPGVPLWRVDKAARDVITKAGYADAYMHGTSHHLGLETHDATPDSPLAPGMVITIEPGIYLPEENIGIRIEDDILITSKSNRNLTKAIAKDPKEIERMMR